VQNEVLEFAEWLVYSACMWSVCLVAGVCACVGGHHDCVVALAAAAAMPRGSVN